MELADKVRLAQEILDNQLFREIFNYYFETLSANIDSLNPLQKDEFTVYHAQRLALQALYNTIENTTHDETSESKGIL